EFRTRNDILYARSNINIVGYSNMWPTDEKASLNTLAKHLTFCNNPDVFTLAGIIEGLSISQEESGSGSLVTLQEFQSQFLNASISYPTQSLAQDTDPWGGPLSQDPYKYEDEPRGRVYPVLPSPTHVDAGLTEEEDALLSIYEGGEYNIPKYDYSIGYDEEYTDVTTDHEPITKYSL
ncbi:hypothetical protein PIB30_071513, partial [Stylosanthes scabra]|nr:hypothetical protein [Stylosanthes scabra]